MQNTKTYFRFTRMQTEILFPYYRKYILEAFISWCKINKKEDSAENLLQFLVEREQIQESKLKWTVVSEFVNRSAAEGKTKTAAIWDIEATLHIPESTCFYIMDKHQMQLKKKLSLDGAPRLV